MLMAPSTHTLSAMTGARVMLNTTLPQLKTTSSCMPPLTPRSRPGHVLLDGDSLADIATCCFPKHPHSPPPRPFTMETAFPEGRLDRADRACLAGDDSSCSAKCWAFSRINSYFQLLLGLRLASSICPESYINVPLNEGSRIPEALECLCAVSNRYQGFPFLGRNCTGQPVTCRHAQKQSLSVRQTTAILVQM